VTQRHGVSVVHGPYAALLISDTGHGMDKQTMKRLFEPFFTTKEVGKGSGLGLAMVYGIMKQSGGYIWAYSEPGLGTTFKLYFPSVAEAPAPPPPTIAEISSTTTGTILVAEDDSLVRGMVRRALIEAGFQVIEAANGHEALAVMQSGSAGVDAVLTDLAMPELGGRQLARRLTEKWPDLPVVFMSGYTEDDVARRGLLDAGVFFLEKPISPEVLTRKMRQVLDGAPRKT
jgi:two-component system, cell cycle sensor histidine kinase and response regulator CckA